MTKPQLNLNCVGVLMDGNRRFAKAKNILRLLGHDAGYEKLKEFLKWAKEMNVKNVIAYALSTENWKRTPEEISHLMKIFSFALGDDLKELIKEETKLKFVGDLKKFPEDIQNKMAEAERES